MQTTRLDTTGMKCPQPVLKLAVTAPDVSPGDVIEVTGDCPTFEKDLRVWCQRMNKVCLSVQDLGDGKQAIQIQF
ncbi:MAG: sulfurtransferase TusA family protein [Candidatus Eisenbacteria bacterium]